MEKFKIRTWDPGLWDSRPWDPKTRDPDTKDPETQDPGTGSLGLGTCDPEIQNPESKELCFESYHFDKKMFLYICLSLSIWSEEFT